MSRADALDEKAASASPGNSVIPPIPLPQPTDASRPFWESCHRHELRIQHCLQCGAFIHYPKIHCPMDGSDRFDWPIMSGKGYVYSFVVVLRAFHASFKLQVPYVVAIIQLEEGVRMISNVVGIDPDKVYVGMRVEVEFDDVSADISLPKFHPYLRGGQ